MPYGAWSDRVNEFFINALILFESKIASSSGSHPLQSPHRLTTASDSLI
jgi:hypothetical protein